MSRLKEFKEQVQQQQREEAQVWEAEIKTLEGRTTECTEITLDEKGEQKLKIIKRLPADIADEFQEFMTRWKEAGIEKLFLDLEEKKGNLTEEQYQKEKERLKEKQRELEEELCEWLSVICVNPLLTKEWFMENKDKYSAEDVLIIIFGWYEGLANRVGQKVQEIETRTRIQKFREESTG